MTRPVHNGAHQTARLVRGPAACIGADWGCVRCGAPPTPGQAVMALASSTNGAAVCGEADRHDLGQDHGGLPVASRAWRWRMARGAWRAARGACRMERCAGAWRMARCVRWLVLLSFCCWVRGPGACGLCIALWILCLLGVLTAGRLGLLRLHGAGCGDVECLCFGGVKRCACMMLLDAGYWCSAWPLTGALELYLYL